MGHLDRALSVPPGAVEDPKSVEAIRAWVAGGKLTCALNVGLWDDPSAWGILLADVARHVADAQFRMTGHNPKETLAKIRRLFEAELSRPTDTPFGDFVP